MTTIPALDDGAPMTVAHCWVFWARNHVPYWRERVAGIIYAADRHGNTFWYSGQFGWLESVSEDTREGADE